jgi:hypothetical protein
MDDGSCAGSDFGLVTPFPRSLVSLDGVFGKTRVERTLKRRSNCLYCFSNIVFCFSKHSTGHNNCENDKPCATCERIQKVIKQYEKEMKTNFDVENTHHTVCLFSDTQIKNFINLVETKFCSDLPGVAEMLHSSKSIEIQDGHHSY